MKETERLLSGLITLSKKAIDIRSEAGNTFKLEVKVLKAGVRRNVPMLPILPFNALPKSECSGCLAL